MPVSRLVTESGGSHRPVAAPTQAAPHGSEGSVVGFAGDILLGAAQGVGDIVGGVFNLIFHPIQTIKGLVMLPITLITRPGDLIRAFTEPYTEAIKSGHSGRAIGRGIVEIGALVFGPKLIAKAANAIQGGGKAGGVIKASTKAAGAATKAGEVAGTAGKASEVANAASKAGKASEVASVAGKVGEVAAVGEKITVVVGTKVGKAAGAASRAKKVADVAGKARTASKATKATDAVRKVANSAKAADEARRVAEAARAIKQAEKAAKATQLAEKTTEAAKAEKALRATNAAKTSKAAETAKAARIAKAAKATRAAKAAKAGAAAKSTKFVKGTPGTRTARVTKVAKAAQASPQMVLREHRIVNFSHDSKLFKIPGKGTMRVTHTHFESIREITFGPASKANEAAKAAKASTAAKAARTAKAAKAVKAGKIAKFPKTAVGKKLVLKTPLRGTDGRFLPRTPDTFKVAKGGKVAKTSAAGKARKIAETPATSKAGKIAHGGAAPKTATRARRVPLPNSAVGAGQRAGKVVDGWFTNVRAELGKMSGLKMKMLPGHVMGLAKGLFTDLAAVAKRLGTQAFTFAQGAWDKIRTFFQGLGERKVGDVVRSPFAQATLK